MSDISTIFRGMRVVAERSCSTLDLGFPEQIVLMYLRANGTSNQSAIAAALDIDKGAITKTIAKLKEKGLVTSEVNPTSKREKLVCLTSDGERLMERLTESYQELEQLMFAGLDERRKQETLEALSVIAANLSTVKGAKP